MNGKPHSAWFQLLRSIGSLWFAAVLLILLLVSLACATVFESTHGTDAALEVFYRSWWFKATLALVGVNVLAAVLVRYPFTRRQAGFVVTHVAILMIFGGAWVTQEYGVDGQVAIVEGQTVTEFGAEGEALVLADPSTRERSSVALDADVFGGLSAVENPAAPVATLGDVSLRVLRYVPDSRQSERMVNDSPFPRPAIQISLSASGMDEPVWVMSNQRATVGALPVSFRVVSDRTELEELLSPSAAADPASKGSVRVEVGGKPYTVPLESCTEKVAAVADTGFSVRVLRYLPHATVGADNKVTNLSDMPVNPAIEVELTGPDGGSDKRLAFSKFPDFSSMHGDVKNDAVKVTFVATTQSAPTTPIEVLSGPDGELHARFSVSGDDLTTAVLTVGQPVDAPWPRRKFTILQRWDRARLDRSVVPVDPPREARTPAVQVKVSGGKSERPVWLQRYRPLKLSVDGRAVEMAFVDRTIPLGFSLTLDRFEVGYYPGLNRPRSFESTVTIADATTGRKQTRIISMNNPTKHGGFSLFQSRYRMDRGKPMSILSVSRDPGMVIVFIGYGAVILGMLMVLKTRVGDRHGGGDQGAVGGRADRAALLHKLGQPGPGPRRRDAQSSCTEQPASAGIGPISIQRQEAKSK